ncbi:MAG: pteridine reductase [Rhodocyclaceae bacterium]
MNAILSGKAILVTGGAKRVGAEIVRRVHGAGADVTLHYRGAQTEAEALAAELNGLRARSVFSVRADLLDAARLPDLVQAAVEHFGRLDGLVNNASSFYATPLGTINEEQWDDLVGTNFKAPLLLSQAAADALRATHGGIVNIVDIHADRPLRGFPLYCAAKAALVGLTRALAVELAPEVRVNAVAPGPIQWPEDEAFDAAARAEIIDHTLLKRVGEPADIARTVVFLLGDAPYVTGQVLAVDGGRSAHL